MLYSSEAKSPSVEFNNIVSAVSKSDKLLPFTIVSENLLNSHNLCPTLWNDYFATKPNKENYIYSGSFDSYSEVKSIKEIQKNTTLIVNKDTYIKDKKSKWLKKYLPLEISTDKNILPYDPANAFELNSIVKAALDIKNSEYVIYTSAHNANFEELGPMFTPNNTDVIRGLYLYKQIGECNDGFKIVASGYTLAIALNVAEWIYYNLQISIEIWSCPSYTLISRFLDEQCFSETYLSLIGNEIYPSDDKLFDDRLTIAMTRYDSRVCEQIAKFFNNRYIAIGDIDEFNVFDFSEMIYIFLYHLMRYELLSLERFKSIVKKI